MKNLVVVIAFLFANTANAQQLTKEQESIKQTFFSFLKFYQKNEAKFNSFHLYKGTGKENNPPFKMQWKEVDRYFAYLRSSVPFVGEAYIKAEKKHFLFNDSCFKADPLEEIAVGFDFDRWAGCQDDVAYCVKWHTSPKNKYEVKITGNNALLRIGAELYEGALDKDISWYFVPFTKEKGKWKIADNIYPEPDPEELPEPETKPKENQ
jgi:hypothetical protein